MSVFIFSLVASVVFGAWQRSCFAGFFLYFLIVLIDEWLDLYFKK